MPIKIERVVFLKDGLRGTMPFEPMTVNNERVTADDIFKKLKVRISHLDYIEETDVGMEVRGKKVKDDNNEDVELKFLTEDLSTSDNKKGEIKECFSCTVMGNKTFYIRNKGYSNGETSGIRLTRI